MDCLNFDVLDRDDHLASYDSTYHDPHTQARADAFSQALDEARNDPRGNANAGGAQATSGAHGSNPPQTPIMLTAAAVGGTGSPPPDKEWASRLAQGLACRGGDQSVAATAQPDGSEHRHDRALRPGVSRCPWFFCPPWSGWPGRAANGVSRIVAGSVAGVAGGAS
jgi:hypothetical protein